MGARTATAAGGLGATEPIQARLPRQPTALASAAATGRSPPPPSAARCARALPCPVTAQRFREPAWHRRARRQRATARVLVRLDAARQLLARHHSGQRLPSSSAAAMPGQRRGGAGGDGGGTGSLAAQVQELQRIVGELQGTRRPPAGNGTEPGGRGGGGGGLRGGGGGGQGGARGGGGGGGTAQPRPAPGRPGDWTCVGCGFYPCFRRAAACIKCGARKPNGGGGADRAALPAPRNQSAYSGPVGAGGSRPLLGRRGQAPTEGRMGDTAPTYRVPGTSLAARAEAGRRRAEQVVDEEGFRRVGRAAAAPVGASGVPASVRPPVATRSSWADLAEETDDARDDEDAREVDDDIDVDEEGDLDDDGAAMGQGRRRTGQGDMQDEDDAHDHRDEHADDAAEACDEQELRAVWTAHRYTVRKLERDPQTPPELLASAKAGRDAAEARWRAAKRPHPLVKRLRWADQDLREAELKLQQRRRELEMHQEETARRTKELEDRLAVDVARVTRKRAAVEALHAEGARLRPNWSTCQAAQVAVGGIATDVAPALLAAIERLGLRPSGDTERIVQDLQLVAASLNRVQGVLQDAVDDVGKTGGPQRYDISGEEGGGPAGSVDGDPHLPPATPAPPPTRWTRPAPHAPWKKLAVSAKSSSSSSSHPLPTATPAATSADAADAARDLLRKRGLETATSTNGDDATRDADNGGAGDRQRPAGEDVGTVLPSGACTNDLAEAARRDQAIAIQQFAAAQLQAQQRPTEHQTQQEEALRDQRQRQQQEELYRHQQALQQAAERRAAEEARQREQLIASLSPQELAQAAELQAQQRAVGAIAFGTQSASEAAGLVHQATAQRRADEAAAAGIQVDVAELVGMSPEQLAQWDYSHDPYA